MLFASSVAKKMLLSEFFICVLLSLNILSRNRHLFQAEIVDRGIVCALFAQKEALIGLPLRVV
jgi:hypothetical protein